jgi:hypothetical protein
MFKKLKLILFLFISFFSVSISAQVDEYIKAENNRIINANNIEKEIQKFINDNFYEYSLPQEVINDIREHINDENEFSNSNLEKALYNAKYTELRKLFFNKFPNKQKEFIANTIPSTLRQQCVNGDFESGTAGYTFWTDSHPNTGGGNNNYPFFLSCATPTSLSATNVMLPVVNDFNARVTYIDNTSPGFLAFDPSLFALGVNVPTLNTNSSNKCIKLNNEEGLGSSDLTTMSRSFPSMNESNLDFNFSIVMNNRISHGQSIQPYFRARLYDQNNNIVDEFCIVADPENCLFNVLSVDSTRRMLYTGWICGRLNASSILNQPGRVEFSVSDCAPSAHFGTVYIDNICGTTCSTLDLGAINLLPTNVNCVDVVGNTPFDVCGTYQTPLNATLNTLTLSITQNGTTVATINTPSQLTASTFCFSVTPSMFGLNASGDFEFDVNATFNVNCPAGTFNYNISDNSANTGPDVTYIACCLPTLVLISPADDTNNLAPISNCKQERSDWIKASNVISFGNSVIGNGIVYHAENFVELNPGFEAVYSSQFAAYPEGCSGNYVYRQENISNTQNSALNDEANLIKVMKGFLMYPNPSAESIEITMNNTLIKDISIISIDGKVVFDKKINKSNKAQINVSNYANGIYMVNVTSIEGILYSEKLIKN